MSEIEDLTAWEVLDSRGNPTVRAEVRTKAGETGRFTVPAGASTGEFEATEIRDGGDRYGGLGVREPVATVNTDLRAAVVGREVTELETIDRVVEEIDGTDDFSSVGANATLAVSGASLHAASADVGAPLYRYLAEMTGGTCSLPMPMANIISGGLHAQGGVEIQDFLIVPRGASTFSEALEMV